MPDGRQVAVAFYKLGNTINITVIFDAETQNPIEMQRGGRQSILNNFKKYTEAN
jgi:hypothetical protein